MDNIFYEEQSMKKYLLYGVFIGAFLGSIFGTEIILEEAIFMYIGVSVGIFLIIFCVSFLVTSLIISKLFVNLYIRINDNNLSFGYSLFQGKWIIEIPYDEIKMIRFRKKGFWSIQFCKRYFFISRTGYVVEVDWKDKKQNGFSIIDHESFFKELRSKIDDSKIDYNPEKYL
jgi:hypothetical protein